MIRLCFLISLISLVSSSAFAGKVISCKNKPAKNKVMCLVNLEQGAVDQKVKITNEYGHTVANGLVQARRGLRWLVAVNPGRFPVKPGYLVNQQKEINFPSDKKADTTTE